MAEIAVAGVTFEGRQTVLSDVYEMQESRKYPITAELIREPSNQYDPNAIAVKVNVDWDGMMYPPRPIGYVPRQVAAWMAPRIDAGEEFDVTAVRVIRGEQPDGHATFGVRIWLEI